MSSISTPGGASSRWLQKTDAPPALASDEDMQAFMEVRHGLRNDGLDLILHSPGGAPEAAEAIVSYLRSRFSRVRMIVPHLALSAAIMIACAAEEIAHRTAERLKRAVPSTPPGALRRRSERRNFPPRRCSPRPCGGRKLSEPLGDAVLAMATLGGYLNRKHDGPPGYKVGRQLATEAQAYELRNRAAAAKPHQRSDKTCD